MINNFINVAESDEFYLLPIEKLLEIISNDKLNVECEEQVYQASMNWVNYNLNERRMHLVDIMSKVRLPLLGTKFLVTKVSTDQLIRKDLVCRDLVDEVKDYHLLKRLRSSSSTYLMTSIMPRTRPQNEVLFAVGGLCNGEAIASVEMYDPQSSSNEWKIVAEMNKPRCAVGVGVLNNQIYAIGNLTFFYYI